MREAAAAFADTPQRWSGRLDQTGTTREGAITYLLVDIKGPAGVPIADHVWIKATAKILRSTPAVPCRVSFRAIARKYKRADGTEDWGLVGVTDFTWRKSRRSAR